MPALMQSSNRDRHEPTTLNTMVFADLVAKPPPDRELRVLDLGGVCQTTIDFFSAYQCHILATGLCDDFQVNKGLDKHSLQQLQKLIQQDIKRQHDRHYDLILCWDLFNYLDNKQLPMLVECLLPVLDGICRCHAFIYTTANRPVQPGSFQILSQDQMLVSSGDAEQHYNDTVTQTTLEKYLPNFKTLRTVLMRNGTQELSFMARS